MQYRSELLNSSSMMNVHISVKLTPLHFMCFCVFFFFLVCISRYSLFLKLSIKCILYDCMSPCLQHVYTPYNQLIVMSWDFFYFGFSITEKKIWGFAWKRERDELNRTYLLFGHVTRSPTILSAISHQWDDDHSLRLAKAKAKVKQLHNSSYVQPLVISGNNLKYF